jgi:hypothetical protein
MIELEFRNVDFCGGRKTGEPGEKPSKQGREKLNSHMTPSLGIEPEITVVRGERLAATPPMLPKMATATVKGTIVNNVLSFL